MLHVILVILKIIGIIVLFIVGIFLLFILGILFVPFKYKTTLSYTENLFVKGKVSWLFHLIVLQFLHEGEDSKLVLRIFGIPFRINGPKKQKKNSKVKKVKVAKQKKHEKDNVQADKLDVPKSDETITEEIKVDEVSSKHKNLHETGTLSTHKTPHVRDKQKKIKKKKKRKQKTIQRDSLQYFKTKLYSFKEEFNNETNRKALCFIWRAIKKSGKHIVPRVFKANIEFSVGDPALTGQLLGILSLVYGLFQYQIVIQPDFESVDLYIKGNCYIKGRLRLIHLLILGLRIYRDRNVKFIINRFKN